MNRNKIRLIAVTAALTAAAATGAFTAPPAAAQGKKPPAKTKPPVKTAPPKPAGSGTVVLGTTQLPGDFGQMGTTYTIGKENPLNFTLTGAEYSAAPLNLGGSTYAPTLEEKLLVLHYTIHNPNPRELALSASGLTFTAVDAKDVNRPSVRAISREGESTSLSVSLKPAQKIAVYTALVVGADGPVPKLIVERENGAPVIRYDLRGKAKPLPAPYPDPADSTGATPLKEVPVTLGTTFPLGMYDVKLESVADAPAGPLGGFTAGAGKRMVTALVTVRNRSTGSRPCTWATFTAILKDADGEKTKAKPTLVKASRDEMSESTLEPGDETRVRFVFELPAGAAAKSVSLMEGYTGKRSVMFNLPAAP